MKNQIATDQNQSRRLIACGVDPKTADMCYIGGHLITTPYEGMLAQWIGDSAMKGEERNAEDFDLTPAYSLSRLLELVPTSIEYRDDHNVSNYFNLDKDETADGSIVYSASYYSEIIEYHLFIIEASDPIEAIVQAIEWLTKAGYTLNQIEE